MFEYQNTKLYAVGLSVLFVFCALSQSFFFFIKCFDPTVYLDSQKQVVFAMSSFLDFFFPSSNQNTVAYFQNDYCLELFIGCSVKI